MPSIPQSHAPAKLAQPNEPMWASAHILNRLINDPITQSLLPKGTPSNTAPAKELNALQNCLTSLENTLTNLTKATTEARKDTKPHPNPPSNPATPQVTQQGSSTPPTYAAKAALPQCP